MPSAMHELIGSGEIDTLNGHSKPNCRGSNVISGTKPKVQFAVKNFAGRSVFLLHIFFKLLIKHANTRHLQEGGLY